MPRSLPAGMIEALVHGFEETFPHVHLHLIVDLDGRIDRAALVAAFRVLVATFPVMGCRYAPAWWRDRWVPWDGDLADLVSVEEVEDVAAATRSAVEARLPSSERPPVRLSAFLRGESTRLVLSVHHMVADGGGLKAAGNVLAAALCGVPPDPPPSPERDLLQLARALRLRDLPVLVAELVREGTRPLWILLARRISRDQDRGPGDPGPRWRTLTLEGAAAEGFVAACRSAGATVNDGLVAAVARLVAGRAVSGPVCAGFTVDLRRFLPGRRSLVTNLHGVSLVMLRRAVAVDPEKVLPAVIAAIGAQKRRLPGLAYTLLPALALHPVPHAVLRVVGRPILDNLARTLHRALAVTNIGALDETLAPFGARARRASILGPFVHGLPVPIVTATGFRGGLTLHVEGTGSLSDEALDRFAVELGAALMPPRASPARISAAEAP